MDRPRRQRRPGTRLWHQAQVAADATVGAGCTLGKGAYVAPAP